MRSAAFRSLLCLLFICWRASAVLTNKTIDDTDPVVKYDSYKPNDVPVRCNSTTTCSIPVLDSKGLIAGTLTSVAGEITIPFNGNQGTSVWVFLATTHNIRCTFHIDGKDVGSFHYNVTNQQGNILGYHDTSIPQGPHKLVIISEQGGLTDFDGLIYQTDVSTSSTNISTEVLPSSTDIPTASAHLRRNNAVIIGSVIGGSVFLLALFGMIFLLLRRRSRGWKNLAVEQPFPINEEKETPSPVSSLVDYLRRLEARFRRIEALAPGSRRASSFLSGGTGRSSPPPYSSNAVASAT
ncbi:hypothetical protein MVEN_00602300 [Mycena venus]|uniref:Uncharacterized protein n=1 Tax=Mycena venus TaxID=2733690 RepID=A0A8H6YPN2_9AGAR|nr:hypothetical protein MVEN_00602300 [Mycena venus]